MNKKTFVLITCFFGIAAWGVVVSAQAQCAKRLLAYYPYYNSYDSTKIPFSELTHICHAFIDINPNGTISIPAGYLEPALLTGAHAVGCKVLVSVGGADVTTFSGVSANAAYTTTFVNAIYNFISTYNYDGVDIDWEFPASAADKANGVTFMQAIRTKFDTSPAPAPSWEISMAITGLSYYGNYLNLPSLNAIVSYYNVMTYNDTGDWSDHTSHNAPLTLTSASDPTYIAADLPGTCAKEVTYLLGAPRSVPASMINMGIPFYGWRFPSESSLYQSCGGNCVDAYEYNYKNVPALIAGGWVRTWDAVAQVPSITNGTAFVTYDDAESVTIKSDYALNVRGLGGIFMWEISEDYTASIPHQPLLDAMYSVWSTYCSANTPTNTATKTSTSTPTNTATTTSTNTPTDTMNTSTSTNTATQTATNTVTDTPLNTATNTMTNTPTDTVNTPTPTNTPTATATNTVTHTWTNTATPTPTNTPTNTAVSTATSTFTDTPTLTVTSNPTVSGVPGIYPNPVNTGSTIYVSLNLTSTSDVQVQVFTTAFRKVRDVSFLQQVPGATVGIETVDREGTQLANGLYYVVIITNQGRHLSKVLILR